MITPAIALQTDKTKLARSVLILVFFLSGMASLLYQTAWQRLLTVYYGIGPISTALIVSVYLLGLGLGAILGGYLVEKVRRGSFLYMTIEAAIACFGFSSPFLLDALGKDTAGSPYILTATYIFVFLSFSTLLMGTTLPLLTKIYNSFALDVVRTVSVLYFVNTFGAATGALIGSYLLISFFGIADTVRLSALLNILLAAQIFLLGRKLPESLPRVVNREPKKPSPLPINVYSLALCTGFIAIGYEVIWFRLLSVLVKDSPYAFSTILSEYLFGVAIGSLGLAKVLERYPPVNRRDLLFGLQSLIAVFVLLWVTAYFYSTRHSSFSSFSRASFAADIHPGVAAAGPLSLFPLIDIFIWPAAFLLVPTILMGASFPLMVSLGPESHNREAETVGKIYFATVIGNVLGGIVTAFILLPLIKTEGTLLLFVSVGLIIGMMIKRRSVRWALAFLLFLAIGVFPRSGELYTIMHWPPGRGYRFYLEEGREGVVGTYVHGESILTYINGSPHGGRPGFDFYARALEAFAHVSTARDVLVIGFGTGSFVETALKCPDLHRLTLVEVNNAVIQNSMKIDLFRKMLQDPRLELVIDDGRRFLLRTGRRFNLIMLDPLRSRTSGSNNLYSRQFFTLLQQHLDPSGVFMLWTDEFSIIPHTLASVFKNVRLYTNNLLLASDASFANHPELREGILTKFGDADRRHILAVKQVFIGDQESINSQTRGRPINEDWVPVTEYFLGRRLLENKTERERIKERLFGRSAGSQ